MAPRTPPRVITLSGTTVASSFSRIQLNAAQRKCRGLRNLCIVGLQWGDEGKGKIVDYYADRFHSVVRYNGGSNAGHTIVIGKKSYVFHLLPSGLLKEKRLLIGPGVAVDPQTLKEEVEMIKREGHKANL